MRRFFYFWIFLMVIVCHVACKNATTGPNPEKAGVNKDSSESYSLNVRGDSVSYLHWAAEDEILVGRGQAADHEGDDVLPRAYSEWT